MSQRLLGIIEEFSVRMRLENSLEEEWLEKDIWVRHNEERNQGSDSGDSELDSDTGKM